MKNITYISLLDWYLTKQRPQHLAEKLSKEYKVSYISLIPWRKNGLLGKHGENDDLRNNKIIVNKNLVVIRKKLLPVRLGIYAQKFNLYILKKIVSKTVQKNKSEIIWLTHPDQIKLIPSFFKGEIVYDCMDNYANFSQDVNVRELVNSNEKKLVDRADIIFTSSIGLKNKIENLTNKNVHLIYNAVNFDLFNTATSKFSDEKIINKSKKMIGYFGGIGSWFDEQLVISLANKFPNVKIKLIGPVSNEKIKEATLIYNNIELTGPVTYDELPNHLKEFDICVMPFKINDLVKDVNPVKIYEYLSAGKIVVAPLYQETKQFEKYIYTYDNEKEFINHITKILDTPKEYISKELINERVKFAKNNTWSKRFMDIDKVIKNFEINKE